MARIMTVAVLGLAGLAAVKGASVVAPIASILAPPAFAASDPTPPCEDGAEDCAAEAPETASEETETETVDVLPELLVALQAERDALEDWREKLEQKEAEILFAKSALDAKHAELAALKAELEHLLERADRENTSDVGRLVEIYKAMKPVQAAAIMNEADIEVSVLVLAAMQPRNSGPILALMQPVRARAISKIILERSRLPGDQNLVNIRLD